MSVVSTFRVCLRRESDLVGPDVVGIYDVVNDYTSIAQGRGRNRVLKGSTSFIIDGVPRGSPMMCQSSYGAVNGSRTDDETKVGQCG